MADDANATDANEEASVDVADSDDDPATEQLLALSELLLQATSEAETIEHRLARSAPSSDSLKELASSIPVLNGDVDRLQVRVDAVAAGTEGARKRRRELTEQAHVLSERVQVLPGRLAEVVTSTSATHKEAGNGHFKRGEYDAAIKCYTEAISVDRKNATFFSNRSACYQARAMWQQAAADARECLALDVSFVKGYLHLVKSLLRLPSGLDEAARVLSSAPMALAGHADLQALSSSVQAELKAAGNTALKQGQHDAAIKLYTQCIALDATQPVYFSNRSAVHQAKRAWREAAADARQCIKLDRAFVKGHLRTSPAPRTSHARHGSERRRDRPCVPQTSPRRCWRRRTRKRPSWLCRQG
jgi:tetratricopeptide (TPR) repeat protein